MTSPKVVAAEAAPGTPRRRVFDSAKALEVARRYPVVQGIALLALIGFAGIALPGLTGRRAILSILILSAFLALAAAGQTLVVLIGALDLSVGPIISASAILTATLYGQHGWSMGAILPLVGGLAFVVGALNGLLAHRFRVQPLIVTLGMGAVVIGLVQVWTGGRAQGSTPPWLSSFSSPNGTVFGLPIPPVLLLWLVVALVLGVVLGRTRPGRWIYATGTNSRAAELALVPVSRLWIGCFAASALFSALVGVLLAGFSGSGDSTLGDPYLFQGIAAVIVGGTAFDGRGSYWRTILGALLLTVLSVILVGKGATAADQQILSGILILLAVGGYVRDRRLRDRI